MRLTLRLRLELDMKVEVDVEIKQGLELERQKRLLMTKLIPTVARRASSNFLALPITLSAFHSAYYFDRSSQ